MKELDGIKIKDCIGCGFCCTKTLCEAARRVYSTIHTPCPGLIWNGERHECKLMTLPGELGSIYRKELYAGEGCCMGLNSWRKEPLEDRTKYSNDPATKYINPLPKEMQLFLTSLGKQFISKDCITLSIMDFNRQLKNEGYSEVQIKAMTDSILRCFDNRRSKFAEEFCG